MRNFLVGVLCVFTLAACGAEPVRAPDPERVTLGVQLAAREACELVDKLPPAPEVAQAQDYCQQTKWSREALPEIVKAIREALKQMPENTGAQ